MYAQNQAFSWLLRGQNEIRMCSHSFNNQHTKFIHCSQQRSRQSLKVECKLLEPHRSWTTWAYSEKNIEVKMNGKFHFEMHLKKLQVFHLSILFFWVLTSLACFANVLLDTNLSLFHGNQPAYRLAEQCSSACMLCKTHTPLSLHVWILI